jgi:hypothetical protein
MDTSKKIASRSDARKLKILTTSRKTGEGFAGSFFAVIMGIRNAVLNEGKIKKTWDYSSPIRQVYGPSARAYYKSLGLFLKE